MNALQAVPEINIPCEDRVRKFCLNLGAFRVMEEHLSKETNNPNFSIIDDFDWTSSKMKDILLIFWAGFYMDAEDDKEPWTIKKAEKVINLYGMQYIQKVIQDSLSRILTMDQITEQRLSAEKKSAKKPSIKQSKENKESKLKTKSKNKKA